MTDNKETLDISTKEITLLGLIAEEPIHAYGLEAKIVERRLDEWSEISTSSIYRVLAGLQEKGFVETELVHEGQGATRKVHGLTQTGCEALLKGIGRLLGEFSPIKNPFTIALAYLPYLDTASAIENLEQRKTSVARWLTEIRAAQAAHAECCSQPTPSAPPGDAETPVGQSLRVRLLFEHVSIHLEAEEQFLDRAVKFLQTNDGRELYVNLRHQYEQPSNRQADDHLGAVTNSEEALP